METDASSLSPRPHYWARGTSSPSGAIMLGIMPPNSEGKRPTGCMSSASHHLFFFLSHLRAFVFIQQTRVPTLCPAAPQAPGGLGCICEEDLTSQSYFPTHQMLPRMLGTPSFSLGSRFKIILNQGTSLVAQRLRICFPMRQGQVWSLVGELRSHMPQ